MAKRVVRDTFVTEAVSPDASVRRQVFAGDTVPDNYEAENASDLEDEEDFRTGYPHEYTEGHGGTEHDYKRSRAAEKKSSSAKSSEKSDS